MRTHLCSLTLALTLVHYVSHASNVDVQVEVRDEQGLPVPGAPVRVVESEVVRDGARSTYPSHLLWTDVNGIASGTLQLLPGTQFITGVTAQHPEDFGVLGDEADAIRPQFEAFKTTFTRGGIASVAVDAQVTAPLELEIGVKRAIPLRFSIVDANGAAKPAVVFLPESTTAAMPQQWSVAEELRVDRAPRLTESKVVVCDASLQRWAVHEIDAVSSVVPDSLVSLTLGESVVGSVPVGIRLIAAGQAPTSGLFRNGSFVTLLRADDLAAASFSVILVPGGEAMASSTGKEVVSPQLAVGDYYVLPGLLGMQVAYSAYELVARGVDLAAIGVPLVALRDGEQVSVDFDYRKVERAILREAGILKP